MVLERTGRFRGPILAALVVAVAYIAELVIGSFIQGEKDAFVKAHPDVQGLESVDTFLNSIPLVGGFLASTVESAVASGNKDAAQLKKYDDALNALGWVQIGTLVVGGVAIVVVTYRAFTTPRQREAQVILLQQAGSSLAAVPVATATGGAPAGLQAVQAVPAAGVQDIAVPSRAEEIVASSPLPATGNPTTFERGTQARAVRDVLARHVEEGGGAANPYAVASAKVKEEGPAKAAEGLPPSEVRAELAEQTAAAKKKA